MIKLMLTFIAATIILGSTTIWECNYCHQQYIGNNPPPFAKCPSKDNKSNHWWTKKKLN